MPSSRIEQRFAACADQNRPALVTFVMAGDPDAETSAAILDGMVNAGADLIELGMPFSDPMADGPAIQLAGQRALGAGMTLEGTLELARRFRARDADTPLILMGYYNPIYSMGVETFLDAAVDAGVDGLIVVDLPAEEDDELCLPALAKGVSFIRLTTPTTDNHRLDTVLRNTSGFVYYISMTGITGAALKNTAAVSEAVNRIKQFTELPIAVGFGIKTSDDAALIGRDADGVVVGSALVSAVAEAKEQGADQAETVDAVHAVVRDLATGCARARR